MTEQNNDSSVEWLNKNVVRFDVVTATWAEAFDLFDLSPVARVWLGVILGGKEENYLLPSLADEDFPALNEAMAWISERED